MRAFKARLPGMFVAVGAVSNRATRMGMAGRRGFRGALSKRAYPKTVGAVSNRANARKPTKNRRRGFQPRNKDGDGR